MRLDKDPFLVNMNMVELEGKKVMVRPSHVESTKGKEVIIGEERQLRMIKLKSLKDGQWKKNERSKPQSRAKATFNILMAKYREDRTGIRERENWTIRFPWIRLVLLQLAAHLASNPGHRHNKIQKVGIIIKGSIIQRLTSRSGHQCRDRRSLHR
jgi:hypothetical protein